METEYLFPFLQISPDPCLGPSTFSLHPAVQFLKMKFNINLPISKAVYLVQAFQPILYSFFWYLAKRTHYKAPHYIIL
jgi:hypothetical protein